ncbi:MAG TPA: flagellar export protein FliJ [Thermoanaerobacterales bacterium]|uniref:flagellar export protein FliJ n=1 Tax=Tepidanaerobacter sp. GT38 TaxID=2722793 RepID=UPI0018430E3B|nr:flagellar export protein FliJ [Tepidanaerobacter sp. GT38]MCG1012433.1 flagellar export protein FliJ [Tepidanaerobacter sp. GT38]HHY41917.1 flagellar export protein FliJ [Thermoanaerobacterales bacterium]
MKRFNFSLETPLRIKQLKEKIEKQELSQAIFKKRMEENRLYELNNVQKNTRIALDKKLLSSANIKDISEYGIFAIDLSFLIKNQQDMVKQAEEVYEKSKENFLRCRRERQIYEKLKEQRYTEYNFMLNREEQKISDELANVNYSRLGEEIS